MEKLKMLEQRLKDCNTSLDVLIKKIDTYVKGYYSIVVYISKFDEVGNNSSDLDIYVLMDEDVEIDNLMFKIEKASCDIEFWTISKFEKQHNLAELYNNIELMKLIKRLKTGLLINKSGICVDKIYNYINAYDIDKKIFNYFKMLAVAEYDDSIKLYENADFIASFACSLRSINYFIASFNAKNGNAILNIKWAPHIFLKKNGYGNKTLVNKYLELAVYIQVNEKNIKNLVEQQLYFLTEQLTNLHMT